MEDARISQRMGNQNFPQRKPEAKEEYVIVLDFLPNGYPFDNRPMFQKTPIVQAVGKTTLALLELVPKKDVFLQPHEEVYIGEGKRDKIHHIVGRMKFENMTSTASKELEFIVSEYVKREEAKFVNFFNTAGSLSTRMHRLELLSGLGKKKMWEIIEEREVEPFKSFDDLRKRIALMPDPIKLISKRIILEMNGNEKHYLFVQN
jgi:putative nucleotide binding protein